MASALHVRLAAVTAAAAIIAMAVGVVVQADDNELSAVRCHSACLQKLQERHAENPEMKRSLKHQILEICKADANCSACIEPCRAPFKNINSCRRKYCTTHRAASSTAAACEASCAFIQKIYSQKPGSCPEVTIPLHVHECTASCHLDGDCAETQKCCSVGCSRKCLAPRPSVARLLPLPTKITVQERRRRRSAVVRWELRRLSSSQSNALSNLFVLQWRWGVHEETLTEWQTILMRNKPYAILKHLLSPSRLYQFRVAAVNSEGSLGFSVPSAAFKLSTDAKAPAAVELSVGAHRFFTSSRLITQLVLWTPPASDLPIKSYHISWWKTTEAEAAAWEESQRSPRRVIAEQQAWRAANGGDLEEEEEGEKIEQFTIGTFNSQSLRHSAVLPSHCTSAELDGLEIASVYFVEVHASVEAIEGELHGEKGVLIVRTHQNQTFLSTESASRSTLLKPPSSEFSRQKSHSNLAESSTQNSHSNLAESSHQESYSNLGKPLLSCHAYAPTAATCTWHMMMMTSSHSDSPIIGYRVALSSPSLRHLHNVSMLPPHATHTSFENLPASTAFVVDVQPVTSRGVGHQLSATFQTPEKVADDEEDEEEDTSEEEDEAHRVRALNENENAMPHGEVVELPLASAASAVSLFNLSVNMFGPPIILLLAHKVLC